MKTVASNPTLTAFRFFLAVFCLLSPMAAQENTFRLTVLGYQWTTTHRTLTFSWPGYANTRFEAPPTLGRRRYQ